MTVLKQNLIDCIKDIPDEKLTAIQPLLLMLYNDTVTIEKLSFDSLSTEDKESIIQAREEFRRGETVSYADINWD